MQHKLLHRKSPKDTFVLYAAFHPSIVAQCVVLGFAHYHVKTRIRRHVAWNILRRIQSAIQFLWATSISTILPSMKIVSKPCINANRWSVLKLLFFYPMKNKYNFFKGLLYSKNCYVPWFNYNYLFSNKMHKKMNDVSSYLLDIILYHLFATVLRLEIRYKLIYI